MTDILETQVIELLTSELGRVPTAAEIGYGLIAPQTLAQIHNSLNVGQSVFTASPGEDIQAAIDKLNLNGGGTLYLVPGMYNMTSDIILYDNIHIQGVGSGGSIIDFGGGAFQMKVIGTAMVPIDSVFLDGFTVQNSSVDLIKVQYGTNFGGNDVASNTGASGIFIDSVDIFNWSVGFVDSCDAGMLVSNVDGSTIQNTFLSNITSGGGYVLDTCSNFALIDSSLDTVVGGGMVLKNTTNTSIGTYSTLNVTGNGIDISNCQDIDISSGLVANCSGDAVYFDDASSRFQITASSFRNNTGYGVNINDSASTDNLFVANFFGNNTAGACSDSGTGTLIRSNIGLADN